MSVKESSSSAKAIMFSTLKTPCHGPILAVRQAAHTSSLHSWAPRSRGCPSHPIRQARPRDSVPINSWRAGHIIERNDTLRPCPCRGSDKYLIWRHHRSDCGSNFTITMAKPFIVEMSPGPVHEPQDISNMSLRSRDKSPQSHIPQSRTSLQIQGRQTWIHGRQTWSDPSLEQHAVTDVLPTTYGPIPK